MTYVLGYRSTSGKKAELGTIVHKVLECLAGLKKVDQDANSRVKYLKIKDDALKEVKCSRIDLMSEELVDELLDASFKFYTEASVHSWDMSDKNMCHNLIWKTLKYNDGQFDPRKRNVLAPEPHFDIPIEEDWAKFEYKMPDGKMVSGQLAIKGTIDLVTIIDDNTIEAIDWKTGKRLDWATGEEKTYEKLCSDPQLLLYNYAISKLFPEYKQSIMSIFFIKDGGPFSMCFDESDQKRFLDMLKDRFQEIQKNDIPKPISSDRSSWKCTKLCHFCKNNWPGTNENMCIYIENHLKKHGMDKTIEKCTSKGFDIGFYEAPG
jgi:hypothetical protein